MNQIANELDLMSKSLVGEDISTEEPKTDPPVDEQEEELDTDPLEEEEEEEAEDDQPETDPPAATDPPEDKDAIIEELRAKLAEQEKDVKTEPPSTEAPYVEQDFIGDVDFDELRDDPKKFNSVLNDIYKRAVSDTTKTLSTQFNQQVPQMIKAANAMKAAADNFYTENEDLVPFKKAVATVFRELAEANPTKTYEELMENTGVEARKRLDLNKPKGDKGKNKSEKKPRLPRKKSGPGKPKGDDNIDPLQQELEEMNEILRR